MGGQGRKSDSNKKSESSVMNTCRFDDSLDYNRISVYNSKWVTSVNFR